MNDKPRTEPCKSCGAKMIWTVTEKGRNMPIDPLPVLNGNIDLTKREDDTYLAKYKKADPEKTGYVSHFATCPNSRQHRRKK